eukprot:CAMPEP_0194698692 /NCGR_PEP_ID=MMETSP0295-20121207/24290_1 /TAXON_ID=39354 /ORGANISM="Heterosigma akashiwo, Strain CCMP2393" /LENGTH=96 /DNA_ID=CAMNT_0039591837 /DNA_START=412 /DNA_END=698 /DNA_ORIENTATION=-
MNHCGLTILVFSCDDNIFLSPHTSVCTSSNYNNNNDDNGVVMLDDCGVCILPQSASSCFLRLIASDEDIISGLYRPLPAVAGRARTRPGAPPPHQP